MALRVTKVVVMVVTIVIVFFCVPYSSALPLPSFTKLPLPPGAMGPEALAFSLDGEGPYTGVRDGRVIKYEGSTTGFQEYAFDSPARSKAVCDGNTNPSAFRGICGRPQGLEFLHRTGKLYIADVTFGLLVVSSNGGLARPVVSSAEGQPFNFLNALDVEQLTEIIYFTDASARYNDSEFNVVMPTNDSTGRLIKYDPNTDVTTVLLRNLSFANGLAVSFNGTYVLVSEYFGNRILKYWLNGLKAGTSEVLLNVVKPDNIRRTPLGDNFWVAAQQTSNGQTVPAAVKFDSFGRVLANISLAKEYNNTPITEVHEKNGALYIGSLSADFIGKYSLL